MSYPRAPATWIETARRRVGPFTTHVSYRAQEGSVVEWSSRGHRKHRSRLSRPRGSGERVWWAPHRASWWIGVLFAVGSTCFFVGPFPGFVERVGSGVDGVVFFVGSVFFTSAAALQWLETINADPGPHEPAGRFRVLTLEPRRIDWWAAGIQLIGTLLFNVNTFHALQSGLDADAYDRLVWTPDVLGCICFLVSSGLAYAEVGHGRHTLAWKIAALNLTGSIAFGISAIAAFWVPSSGSVLDLAAANGFTALGGLCFLIGSVLLLPEGAAGPARSDDTVTAPAG
jgi:hypothetical protein